MAAKIGALWEKESRKGQHFLSGEIQIGGQRMQIVCFKNDRKEPGSKQPDWTILEGEDRQRRQAGDEPNRTPAKHYSPERPVFDDGEDTPF